ncbi:MAG TPA: hypothetical protein VGQ69_00385 [Gemmatimonadales bacterium]|jgi:hypothetical protein|nr:hypothetical protein [Gemmatimonadales bacterium]
MNAALNRVILAGVLVPALLQAQTINPKQATLRLFEQGSGGVLAAEKRVYTAYFNTVRSHYIGVEVTVEYAPAASAFKLAIGCQMTRPDGSVVDGIWKIGMDIAAGSTRAVAANYLFGAGKAGWQTGIHKVTCAATQPLGETSFQMSPGPSLLASMELRLQDVRFFPTGAKLTPPGERQYLDHFSSAEATRIGIELSFVHPGVSQAGEVPIDCYYLATTAWVLGSFTIVYELTPPATSGSAALGLGWDQPGKWSKGTYLAVCQIHGRPISVDRFTVW